MFVGKIKSLFRKNEQVNSSTDKSCISNIKESEKYLHKRIIGSTGSYKTSSMIFPVLDKDKENHK